jgi:large subunit ribosomal protein L30
MKQYRCTQYRSSIRVCPQQRKILRSMGLDKLGKSKVLPDCPAVVGMIEKVKHLVKVELC